MDTLLRLLKVLWLHMITITTAWLPDYTFVLQLRGFLARPCFKKCGRNLQIASRVYIGFPNRLELGRDVFMACGTWIQATGSISIEDEVLLGPYSVLVAGDHTELDGSYRFGVASRGPIRLGKGSWIGAHATVTHSVQIGAGVLVAANAVVTNSLPAHCIAGGIPAKVIRNKREEPLAETK